MGAAKGITKTLTSAGTFGGTNYNDVINGSVGIDTLWGGNGDDVIHGNGGNDVLWGDSGSNSDANDNGQDQLFGDAGNDNVHGGNAKDLVDGGDGNDFVYGDNGVDDVRGGEGSDFLFGGNGDDTLLGGLANSVSGYEDVLTGGNGGDRFVFTSTSADVTTDSRYTTGAPGAIAGSGESATWSKPWDVVTDFTHLEDKIDLSQLASLSGHDLIWRGAHGTDASAGTLISGLAYGVWTDSAKAFLFADTDGDGQADMKVQVSGVGSGDFVGVTYDTLAPAATVNIVDTLLWDGDNSSLVTISFDEEVIGFDIADVSAANGTLSGFLQIDTTHWQAIFTAADGFEGIGSVTVGTGYTDYSYNAGTGGSDTVTIDTLNPTATIDIVDSLLWDGDSNSSVTITFSEAVTGLLEGDFVATGGTISNLTDSGDGIHWTATFTATDNYDSDDGLLPDGAGLALTAGSYTDLVGNLGSGGSDTVYVDTKNPTATMTISPMTMTDGVPSGTVTLVFSEAINPATLSAADFAFSHGTLGAFTSADNTTWTASFLAMDGYDGAAQIALTGAYNDVVGNAGTGTSVDFTIDRFEAAAATVARVEFVPQPDFDHNGQGVGAFGHFLAYDAGGNLIENAFTQGSLSDKVVLATDGTISAIHPINGNDDLSFTLFGQDVEIILGGGSSDILTGSSDAILIMFGYGGGDMLQGGGYGDTLFGGSNNAPGHIDALLGGAGNDFLFGGSDDDWLIGNEGADYLSGGAGNDVFVFGPGSSTIALSDLISDFDAAQERLDLTLFDSNTATVANDAFLSFNQNTTVSANSVNWFTNGGNTFVQGDVNGDAIADFSIMLQGMHTLTTTNVTL